MILNEVFNEVFKITNIPGSPRKFIKYVGFVRDVRTGIHGLLIFKNDEYSIWTISNYGDTLKVSLNKTKPAFDSALSDIQHIGRGNDISIIATTVLSKVHHFQFDNESEKFVVTHINLPDALFVRQLPNRSALIVVTNEGKLAKYSVEGHLQIIVDIPNNALAKSFATSPNGKTVAIGDRAGKLYIFDIEVMECQHTIDTQTGSINAVTFSSDGNQLLVAGKQGVQLYTYEDLGTASWAYTKSFMHHTDDVTSVVVYSGPNYERFASGSQDGTVCVWSFSEEEPLQVIKLKDEIPTSVNFSPDGLYLILSTDETSIRIYRTTFTGDYSEPQYFIDEEAMKEDFWHLEGNSIFDPLALRKSMGLFDPEKESLIFLKMDANPELKLREAYDLVAEFNAQLLEEQNKLIRGLRSQRRRQRRIIAFQAKVEQMRVAALRNGQDFVPPATPPFSDVEDENLEELSDIEAMFEREPTPVEEVKENIEDANPFASPLSSVVNSDAEQQKSGSDNEGESQPLDFSMLSDSDEDEQQQASQEINQDVNEEEGSPLKSPVSEPNELISPIKSPASVPNEDQQAPTEEEVADANQLWASDDEEMAKQPIQSPKPANEDVEMEDLDANKSPVPEEEFPVSRHSSPRDLRSPPKSNESSPLASPPNTTESP